MRYTNRNRNKLPAIFTQRRSGQCVQSGNEQGLEQTVQRHSFPPYPARFPTTTLLATGVGRTLEHMNVLWYENMPLL